MNNLTNFGPSMRFFKMFGRRHHLSGGHFLFRLPLIILWTLIVILILYKSIKSTYPYNDSHVPNTINTKLLPEQLAVRGTSPTVGQEDQYQTDNDAERTTDSSSTRRDANGDGHTSPPPSSANEPVVVIAGIESRAASHLNEAAAAAHQSLVGSLTTTRRSPVSDYMRRNEIFILLVQDDDPISKAYKLNTVSMNMNNGNMYPNSASRLGPTKSPNTSTHKLAVSVHIRQLIDILNYHRIDYTLDVMRTTGLPTELLQNPKKYSVIVIDDFLKYDRLNRWARDQLDRYCRYNRIGVITYLIDSGRLNYHQGDDTASNIPGTPPKGSVPLESAQMPSSSDTIGSGQMMKLTTKQYPMSFEFFNLNCRNLTSANCLVDYQLNDKAQLLRILKRKPNFILRGDLTTNLGVRSLMTMTSNHATHEPLTWARLRRPQVPLLRHQLNKRYATNGAELLANSTQAADYDTLASVVRVRKRAVLPSPTLATPGYYSDDPSGDREQNTSDGVGAGGPRWSSSDEYLDDTRMGRENYAEDLPHGGESELLSSNDQQGGGGGDLSGEEEGQDSADETEDAPGGRKVIAMLDNGLYDDIRRVIFGLSNQHWLNRLLLLDAIEHLSYGEILTPLERYIQIDIDDIFVGATGTRLNKSDVVALIETQKYFATLMEGGEFKFNLGFSGHYFGRGSEAEQLGDRELIANSNKFTWFCHFWSHSKAHLFNTTEALSMELKRNLKFAQDNRLTLIGHRGPPSNYDLEHQNHRRLDNQQPLLPPTYAVAPHHSGVYPIHAPLYEAWRSILNVQITTTEEYPHLRPANQRRGFVHETIKVLPRQTCGLYTHTIFKSRYPGGFKKLIASIRGGELFETIVHNPINIYMTHMSNYGNDRLAPFTFKALFEFVKEYTNLRLKYSPIIKADTDDDDKDDDASQRHQVEDSTKQTVTGGPMFLADLYFSLHPEEREPLWTNPCDDKRHLAIWSLRKLELCHIVPKLLIVGPQKTGTTALQSFLKLNPSIGTSSMSSEDFEEVQFFNDKHYLKGTDWYFERFITQRDGKQRNISSGTNTTTTTNPSIFLDKSATYFDDPKAPRRASSLLPDAYIVILLINPADRAYSWYQHMKAHGDPIASEFSFDEVIMFQETTTSDKMTTTTTTRTASPALIRSNGTSTTTTSTSSSSSSSNGLGGRSLTEHQIVAMRALRNRCLHPGYYSNHLLRWLNYYQSRQIVIIDGEWFKFNPKAVLNRLQLLLNLPEQVDYDKLLVYQRSKGFYCERKGGGGGGDDDDDATDLAGDRSSRNVNGSRQTINRGNNNKRNHHHHTAPNIKCLGSGKGRKYASMSANSRAYLDDHYLSHNRQLARLLYEIGQPLPRWLDRSINPLPTTVRLL